MEEKCPNCLKLEARIAEQDKLIAELLQRIEALENELRKGKRQAHPFSSGKSKLQQKRPGRRPSQGTFDYRHEPELAQISATVSRHLVHCPDCGLPLSQRRQHVNWQTDLAEMAPEVTRYETESGWCSQCQERKRSVCTGQIVTASGSSAHGLGPRVKALSANLKHRLGIPYRKQEELFQTLFGLKVTPGGLCQAGQSMSEKLSAVYEELAEVLSQAATVHSDETGWRVGTLSAWLWVLSNRETTLYRVENNRSHEVLLKVLGPDYAGVLTSDRAKAYDHKKLAKWLKQKCLAHLLRNLSELEAKQQKAAVKFAREVKQVLKAALKLKNRSEKLLPEVYAKRCQEIERKLERVLSQERKLSEPHNVSMAEQLRKHRADLLRFLHHPAVEGTNNLAERDLRPAVIARKTGRCNKTKRGAKTHAVLASVLATAVKRGCNPIQALQELLLAKSPSLASLNST